jgi:hypothetical protein
MRLKGSKSGRGFGKLNLAHAITHIYVHTAAGQSPPLCIWNLYYICKGI